MITVTIEYTQPWLIILIPKFRDLDHVSLMCVCVRMSMFVQFFAEKYKHIQILCAVSCVAATVLHPSLPKLSYNG
jgi:hypothetical protein